MKPYYEQDGITIYHGDCIKTLRQLPSKSVNMCVTSPPYWGLRDYGVDGQLGLESTVEEYIRNILQVCIEIDRVLVDDGTLWLNLGDTYSGSGRGGNPGDSDFLQHGNIGSLSVRGRTQNIDIPDKNLIGVPWRIALALQESGWYLRSDIIWHKPNAMPESVRDRPSSAHEHLFLLSKSARYFYDAEAIAVPTTTHDPSKRNRDLGKLNKTPGRRRIGGLMSNVYENRNRRNVWTIPVRPFSGAHFAVFPEQLVEPCILAGCPTGGVVLDPFHGSGTTAVTAKRSGRNYIGIELNEEYINLSINRISQRELFGVAP